MHVGCWASSYRIQRSGNNVTGAEDERESGCSGVVPLPLPRRRLCCFGRSSLLLLPLFSAAASLLLPQHRLLSTYAPRPSSLSNRFCLPLGFCRSSCFSSSPFLECSPVIILNFVFFFRSFCLPYLISFTQ